MRKLLVLPIIFALLFTFCQSDEEKAAKEALANKGKQMTTMEDMKLIGIAIEDCLSDTYQAPEAASMKDLEKLLVPNYIKQVPTTDHWGNDYYYKYGTGDERQDYWIASAGPDGKFENFQKAGDDIVFHNGEFL